MMKTKTKPASRSAPSVKHETAPPAPPAKAESHKIATTYGNGLKVDFEFRDLIPPLSPEESAQLLANLLREGCRDPITVWEGQDLILDGHNRIEICEDNDIPYGIVHLALPNRAAAIEWIIKNQLGRRNLPAAQVEYLRGKRLENEKGSRGGDQKAKRQVDASKTPAAAAPNSSAVPEPYTPFRKGKTAARIAKEAGVSTRTVERNGTFAKAVDRLALAGGPGLRKNLLSGAVTMSDKAAQAIVDLPAAALKVTAERINNGVYNVDTAIPASHRPTAAAKKAAKAPEDNPGKRLESSIAIAENIRTVSMRLMEIQGILEQASKSGTFQALKRISELLTFVDGLYP